MSTGPAMKFCRCVNDNQNLFSLKIYRNEEGENMNMFKEGTYVLIMLVMFAWAGDTAGLPETLLIDDASREILFLDLYRRVSALETRTQMSDAIDWTQQTQFDRLKLLAENQQQWLEDLEAVVRPNGRCAKPAPVKRRRISTMT